MSIHIPAYVGATVQETMPFEARVNWYAIWIKAYPVSNIHFKFPHLGQTAGFVSERSYP